MNDDIKHVIACMYDAHRYFPDWSRQKRIEWAWKRAELDQRLGSRRAFVPVSTMWGERYGR